MDFSESLVFPKLRTFRGPIDTTDVRQDVPALEAHMSQGSAYDGQVVWVTSENAAYLIEDARALQYSVLLSQHRETVQTTDDSPVTTGGLPIVDTEGAVQRTEAQVIAQSGSGDVGVWKAAACFTYTSGSLRIVGYPTVVREAVDMGLQAAEIQFHASGQLEVTGLAGATITWRAAVQQERL